MRDASLPADRRFTPTCVGKAQKRPLLRRLGQVHPHVRGEGSTWKARCQLVPGSPPRAWGRRLGYDALPGHDRFTPTCVGKAAAKEKGAGAPPVHPHVRGEGSCLLRDRVALRGSPPRAWGRLAR